MLTRRASELFIDEKQKSKKEKEKAQERMSLSRSLLTHRP